MWHLIGLHCLPMTLLRVSRQTTWHVWTVTCLTWISTNFHADWPQEMVHLIVMPKFLHTWCSTNLARYIFNSIILTQYLTNLTQHSTILIRYLTNLTRYSTNLLTWYSTILTRYSTLDKKKPSCATWFCVNMSSFLVCFASVFWPNKARN